MWRFLGWAESDIEVMSERGELSAMQVRDAYAELMDMVVHWSIWHV